MAALLFILSLLILPGSTHSQWVQVGFSAEGCVAAPERVIVAEEAGSWQQEIWLRERFDIRRQFVLSEPLVLPRNTSKGTFAVSWEQEGLTFSYRFQPLSGKPLQILLPEVNGGSKGEVIEAPAVVLNLSPNPFNPTTTVSLGLPEASHVRLEVFDVLGRSQSVLANENRPAGRHRWRLDGSNWATGTYFLSYRISPGRSGVRRLVLIK